jgi:hypothetical protein
MSVAAGGRVRFGCRDGAGACRTAARQIQRETAGASACQREPGTGGHLACGRRIVEGHLPGTGHRRRHGLSSPLKLLHFRLLSPGFLLPRLPRASIQPTPVPQRTPAVLLRAQGRIINLGNPPMAANVADRNPHHPPSHACNYRFDPRSENPSSLEESTLHYALRSFYR